MSSQDKNLSYEILTLSHFGFKYCSVPCSEKRRPSDKDLPVKKYICPIQEFPTSWRKVLIKTPFEIVRELAQAVVKFFTLNEKMWLFESLSPLHISSNCGVLSLCEYIYEKTGEINPKTSDGSTPFHLAAREGHLEVCRFIIEKLSCKNPGDRAGRTPLHEAASSGHTEVYSLIMGMFLFN